MRICIGLFLVVVFISCKPNNKRGEEQIEHNYSKLEQWEEWRLYTDDGTNLFMREFGRGDTVLVLHGGWGAEHSYLIKPFTKLADDYHFIFYDQRGSLRSPCPDSLISIDNLILDIERIRIETGQEKLLLVGHSMGGFLGMSYLSQYPDHVKGLILISSAPAKGTTKKLTEDIQKTALKRWKRSAVIDTLKANDLSEQIEDRYTDKQRGRWHHITFAAINLHHIKNWRKVRGAFYHQGKTGSILASSTSQKWNFIETLKKVNFPVSIIHGDDDYLPLRYQKEWIPEVPNAELTIIKNAGHLCWIDRPDKFENEIRNALGKFKRSR